MNDAVTVVMDDSSSGVSTCPSPINTSHSSINQSFSSINPSFSSIDQSRSSIDQSRSSIDQSRSSINPSFSLIDQSRSSIVQSRSSIDQSRSSINPSRSSIDQSRSSINPSRSIYRSRSSASHSPSPVSTEASSSPVSPSPSSSGAPVTSSPSSSSGATIVMSPENTLSSDDSTSEVSMISKQKIVKKKVRPPSKLCPYCASHIHYLYGHLRSRHGNHIAVKRAKDLPVNHPLKTFILGQIRAMGIDRYTKRRSEFRASMEVVSQEVEGVSSKGQGSEVRDCGGRGQMVVQGQGSAVRDCDGRGQMVGHEVMDEATSGSMTEDDCVLGHVMAGQQIIGCILGQKVKKPKVKGGCITNGDDCCDTCTTIFRAWETGKNTGHCTTAAKGNDSTAKRNNSYTKGRELNRQLKMKATVDLCPRLSQPCGPARGRHVAMDRNLKKSRFPRRIRKSTVNEAIFDYYTSNTSSSPDLGHDSCDQAIPFYSSQDSNSTDIKPNTSPRHRHKKIRWSHEENSRLVEVFDQWLLRKQIPPGSKLRQAKETLFQYRSVAQLRSKIHNIISGKSKINSA